MPGSSDAIGTNVGLGSPHLTAIMTSLKLDEKVLFLQTGTINVSRVYT
jgi:hypothetical protein